MNRFRKSSAVFAALTLTAALSACAGAQSGGGGEDDGVFKVGLLLPSVGPFAGIAEDQADGFRHYVENVAGGSFGDTEVEIVTGDEGNDPTLAQESIQRLVEKDEVDAIVGVISSAVAYAIAPYIAESGVPTIFTATTADDLTQRQHAPNMFRVSNAASQIMLPLGKHACEDLGYKTAAMVSLDYSFGWEAMGGFAKGYEDAGCKVTQELYTPLGTADWGSVAQSIDKSVDVIIQTSSGSDAAKFLQAYGDFGLTDIPMIANGFGTDPSTLPEPTQRKLALPIQSVMYYAEALDTPANNEFRESFRKEYSYTPGIYAEAAYVAGMVLDAAAADLDEISYETVTDAIADVKLDDAPRGALQFDEYGQANLPVYLRQMKDVDGEYMNTVVETLGEGLSQFWTFDPDEAMAEEPYNDLKGSWVN
jgi:branched-chain amino acid transport system substrate-binding protein